MKRTSKALSYADVGVSVDIEAKAAKILYEASKQTWANRLSLIGEVVVPVDNFAGTRFVQVDNLPKGTVMFGGSDGIATKAAIAEMADLYDTLAFDLMAMVCDDAVVRGGEPVLVKSVLDVNSLGSDNKRLKYIRQLAKGYVAAAKQAGVAIINGELAQLNDQMGDLDRFKLSWSADVTWFAHESRLLTGEKVKVGDSIVGLEEPGVRCNGISLIRACLEKAHGQNWSDIKLKGRKLIDYALQPSKIYSPAAVEMFGGYDLQRQPQAEVRGIANITGGGLPEKLGRLLKPSGLGAELDNLFEPSPLFLYCQKVGNVSDHEAYKTWNMGTGMVVVTPEPSAVIGVAKKYRINAKIIGKVIKKPEINIASQGHQKTANLIYDLK